MIGTKRPSGVEIRITITDDQAKMAEFLMEYEDLPLKHVIGRAIRDKYTKVPKQYREGRCP